MLRERQHLYFFRKIEDIIKRTISLEESRLLIKGTSELIENKSKHKKCTPWCVNRYIRWYSKYVSSMLEGAHAMSQWRGVIRAGEGTVRAGKDF